MTYAKQILTDFLKWDCEVRYGTSSSYLEGIDKLVDKYLANMPSPIECTKCGLMGNSVIPPMCHNTECEAKQPIPII